MTKSEREAYKAWLASLKQGDTLAVVRVSDGKWTIAKVAFVYSDEFGIDTGERWHSRYRKDNGRLKDTTRCGPHMLRVATPEMLAEYEHRKKCSEARSRFRRYNCWDNISDAKALRIVAILDEPEPS